MKTLEEFTVLADYRAFTKARFQQIAAHGDPVYISVKPFDFDCWSGNAVLVGPRGARLHKVLKKEKVKFREGRCIVQDRTVYVEELSGGLLQRANKTLQKLSIGYTFKPGAAPGDSPQAQAALTNWADYKTFLRARFAKIAAQPAPFFLSKKRATFDDDGSPWQGFCVLAGPKARAAMLAFKKAGLGFVEGTCTAVGKRLIVEGIPAALLKRANKTLVRLKLGYTAAAPVLAAPAASRGEIAFKALLEVAFPAVQKALRSGSPHASGLRRFVALASKLQRAKDFDGAMQALRSAKTLLGAPAAQSQQVAASTPTPAKSAPEPPRGVQLDALLDRIVGDGQDRTKAMAKWDVPQRSELFKNPTELDKFFADLNSGISKVDDYVSYVRRAVDYFSKTNDSTVLQGIDGALSGISKVSKRLRAGLGKTVDVIDAIKHVKTFVDTADRFVTLTKKMDPRDIDSVKSWVQSVRGLWGAAGDFLNWIQDKQMIKAALRGSKLGGVLGAALPIVAAQFEVGLKALETGLKVVHAYLQRLEKYTDQIDGVARPEKPQPPGEWHTMEETGRGAAAWEDMVLRSNIDAAHAKKIREGTQVFDSKLFPRIYRRAQKPVRIALQKTIRATRRKTRLLDQKLQRLQSRREEIGTRLGNLRREQADLYTQNGQPNRRLESHESELESQLDEVGGRIRALENAIPKVEMGSRLRKWRACIIQFDGEPMPTADQIVMFRRLRRQGQGFPLYDRIYDAGLKKHLDALSDEFRKSIASNLD